MSSVCEVCRRDRAREYRVRHARTGAKASRCRERGATDRPRLVDARRASSRSNAAEAERAGLVSRIVPADKVLDEAIAVAERIGQMSRPIAMMVKESVNRAFETTLAEGVLFERRLFHSTFATEDQKEGMAAFIAKRKPAFRNR